MQIHVKQCSHPPGVQPRFELDIGDTVLVKEDRGKYFVAKIESVDSANIVVATAYSGQEGATIRISTGDIITLILGGDYID